MTRQQRRQLERKNITPQMFGARYLTSEEQNNLFEKGFKTGMKEVSEIVFYMTAYTIDYKLDLSQEEKIELLKAVYNNIDAYRTGHLNPEDYDVIKKEMNEKGIRMK